MRLLLILFLLGGCSASPYLKVSAGHIVSQRDYWSFQTEEGMSNPCDASARLEVGLEKRLSPLIVGGVHYAHNSNLDCGNPFDDYDEFFKNAFEASIKVGGVR